MINILSLVSPKHMGKSTSFFRVTLLASLAINQTITNKLRIVSYKCRSFRSNDSIVKQLLENYGVLFFRKLCLPTDDMTGNNTNTCFTPATPSTSPNGGRPAGGLAVFWKTTDTINI